ncbi:DinB family protein [Aquincola sp. S2]|uniref:DinB family protein n=1 Tax=Pseudaquabacterium terrae TaxID=2732868 RepID=A0ABX2EAH0_9BURK|nr:DinB family protein [Aquabacterium terrae]NRF66064.1 DinB family protein [Aquabacterium terrae]
MALDLLHYLRIQAHANRLANHRLHTAMAPLTRDELHAPRTSFFPSLIETLNHILMVDVYYLAALHGEADMVKQADEVPQHDTLPPLAAAQAVADHRLITFCEALDAAGLDAEVRMQRRDHVQRDRAGHVLAHLLNHQVHHRGQVHAMLAGTRIAPPQIDEFMLPSEGHLREPDMAALGWREVAVYGPLLPPSRG